MDLIFSDHFSRNEPGVFDPLRDTLLTHGDYYMHLADLTSYLEARRAARSSCMRTADGWARKAILNVASSGQVFERPHHRRICGRDLEGGAMPGAVETSAPARSEDDHGNLSRWPASPRRKEMLVDVARLEREYFAAPARRG